MFLSTRLGEVDNLCDSVGDKEPAEPGRCTEVAGGGAQTKVGGEALGKGPKALGWAV